MYVRHCFTTSFCKEEPYKKSFPMPIIGYNDLNICGNSGAFEVRHDSCHAWAYTNVLPCVGLHQRAAMHRPTPRAAMLRPTPTCCHAWAYTNVLPCMGLHQRAAIHGPTPTCCHACAYTNVLPCMRLHQRAHASMDCKIKTSLVTKVAEHIGIIIDSVIQFTKFNIVLS